MNYCIHCMKPILNGDSRCQYCGKPFEYNSPVHHLKTGIILNNRYLIGASIGEGGFGITYISHDTKLDMNVAIKEFYPNTYISRNNNVSNNIVINNSEEYNTLFLKEKDCFLQEARILAKFSNESGIVNVRDFFEENNTAYIVMTYLNGETLKDYLKRNTKIAYQNVVEMMIPVIESLKKVHNQGLIHRDISPDNIMLVNNQAKLLDFGNARDITDIQNKSISIILKLGYAPEEQYRKKGEQGAWTDIYSICATMYKCITGITPDDSTQRVYKDEVKKPSELGIKISPSVENAIMRGMSVFQKDRYQLADELLNALQLDSTVLLEETVYNNPIDERTVYQSVNDDITNHLLDAQNEEIPVYNPNTEESIPIYNPTEESIPTYKPDINTSTEVSEVSDSSKSLKTKKKNRILPIIIVGIVLVATSGLLFINSKYSINYDKIITNPLSSIKDNSIYLTSERITSDTIKQLSKFSKLESIHFCECTFDENTFLDISNLPDTIKTIEISNCNLTNENLSKIDFSQFPLLEYLNIKENEQFSDLSSISSSFGNLRNLNIDGTSVKDFSVLESASMLDRISAIQCNITDLSSLKSDSLGSLDVSENNLINVDFTQNLPNLSNLTADSNQISDISSLKDNPKIYSLRISDNKISDISSLKNIERLSTLHINDNLINDISPLENSINLSKLYICNNKIESLEPLKNCQKLETLEATNNNIKNLDGLENAIQLKELIAPDNNIDNIMGITNCTILNNVNLNNNAIESIDILKKNTTLKTLQLNNNRISDISAISQCVELTTLSINDNNIVDISSISKCHKLQFLSLDRNKITSLKSLENNDELIGITAEGNLLENLDGLNNMQKILFIYVPNNKISTTDAIAEINSESGLSIKMLNLSNNLIENINLSPTIEYSALSIYNNPLKSYDGIKQLTGTKLQISYIDNISDYNVADGYFNIDVIDCPLDKQISVTNSISKLYINFLTVQEADSLNLETKNSIFGIDSDKTKDSK